MKDASALKLTLDAEKFNVHHLKFYFTNFSYYVVI